MNDPAVPLVALRTESADASDERGVAAHTVVLRIGLLDYRSTARLRQALQECPSGPGVHLAVDLSDAGTDHDMTVFAILAEKVRALHTTGSTVTALRPSTRLTHLLTALGVRVLHHPDAHWPRRDEQS
jgi:hypothetical protein